MTKTVEVPEGRFRVSIIARIKHGDLREALKRRGWTQKQAAEFLGMDQSAFGLLINLKRIPQKLTKEQEAKLLELTGKMPEDLWPEFIRSKEFLEAPKVLEAIRDFTPAMLEAGGLLQLPPAPDEVYDAKELGLVLQEVLELLPPREAEVIRKVFLEERDEAEVAQEYGLKSRSLYPTIRKALRRLRHPYLARRLRPFIDPDR